MASQHLFFLTDFDETLTLPGKDTTSRLASTAYTHQHSGSRFPPWSSFVDAYMRDYDRCAQSCPPATRNTLEAEKEFLKSLKSVERASVERVEASGVFKNLDLPTFFQTAVGDRHRLEELMRKGWWTAMKKVLERGESRGTVAVISVNWSRGWIRECLEGSIQSEEGEMTEARRIGIYANELVVKDDGRTTTGLLDRWFGQEDSGIWTGWDKLRVMRDIIQKNWGSLEEERENPALVIYVGDSTTDLLCLMEADVGIIFGYKLDSVCERLGVEIQEGLSVEDSGSEVGVWKKLIRIKDWGEVEYWVDAM